MNRILIVKMSSLGDVIHTLPAVSDAHAALGEEVKVDWVVSEQYATIPAWHPAIDKVIPVAPRRWRKDISWESWSQFLGYRNSLREHRYAAVIDAHGLLKSAVLGCALARGQSHGYDWSSIREKSAVMLYDHTHAVAQTAHAVTRSRELFAAALGYALPASEPDYGIRPPDDVCPRDAVMLVPHTSKEAKLWPTERWIGLGKALRADGLAIDVTWGNPEEQERAAHIAAACGGAVAPRMGLELMSAFIAGAKGMVSLDTGLAHLAAAHGVPNLCLCVATAPERSGAFGRNQAAVGKALGIDVPEAHAMLRRLLHAAG